MLQKRSVVLNARQFKFSCMSSRAFSVKTFPSELLLEGWARNYFRFKKYVFDGSRLENERSSNFYTNKEKLFIFTKTSCTNIKTFAGNSHFPSRPISLKCLFKSKQFSADSNHVLRPPISSTLWAPCFDPRIQFFMIKFSITGADFSSSTEM